VAGLGLDDRGLAAMLSAAVVAFVIEADNEFELGFQADRPGLVPSLVVWLNLLQHFGGEPASVRELSTRSMTSIEQVRFLVGKLEHWGVLTVGTGPEAGHPASRRRQSVSSVKPSSEVGLGEVAVRAAARWPGVIEKVEERWRERFGPSLTSALKAASALATRAGVLMPDAIPVASANRVGARDWKDLPAGDLPEPSHARIPVLLSRALTAAQIAYEELSPLPMALTANTLRVIDGDGIAAARLHTLSGNPPETAASQVTALTKGLGLAELVKDPARRAKAVRLTLAGSAAQAEHARLTAEADASLDPDRAADRAIRRMLTARYNGDLAIRGTLAPQPGTRRFSTEAVTGRPVDDRDHEIVTQTEIFQRDPLSALPHFPVWEATRGFRP
jgi:hypothetical protein